MFKTAIAVWLVLFQMQLFAQDSVKTESTIPRYMLPKIIVEAPRVPMDIWTSPLSIDLTVQKPGESLDPGRNTLLPAFTGMTAVQLQNRSNPGQGDRLMIRGIGSRAAFGVRGLVVMLDDIPLTFADGQTQLNSLMPALVNEIQVIKGPSSSLYGNSAGGVILFSSLAPGEQKLHLLTRTMAGSYGLWQQQFSVSGTLDRHAYRLDFIQRQSDGFRDHSASKTSWLNFKYHYSLKAHNVSLSVQRVSSPYLLSPSSLDKSQAKENPQMARRYIQQQGSGKSLGQFQAGLTWNWQRDNLESRITLYGIRRDLQNAIPGRYIDLYRRAGGVHSKITLQDFFAIRITTGFDMDLQDDVRTEFANLGIPDLDIPPSDRFGAIRLGERQLDQVENIVSWSPFIHAQRSWGIVQMLAGARYDHMRFKAEDHYFVDGYDDSGQRSLSEWSPILAASAQIKPYMVLYGNMSSSFQSPTANELSNRPDARGGFNPDLDSEHIQSMELGLRFLWAQHSLLQATGFRYVIRNLLVPYQIDDPFLDAVYYRNAGHANHTGLELQWDWHPIPNISFRQTAEYSTYIYQDYQLQNDKGRIVSLNTQIPGVPQKRLSSRFAWSQDHFELEWFWQWQDRMYGNDWNGPPPGSQLSSEFFVSDPQHWTSIQVSGSGSLFDIPFTLYGGIDNLFDQDIIGSLVVNAFGNRFFEPASGQSFFLGLELEKDF